MCMCTCSIMYSSQQVILTVPITVEYIVNLRYMHIHWTGHTLPSIMESLDSHSLSVTESSSTRNGVSSYTLTCAENRTPPTFTTSGMWHSSPVLLPTVSLGGEPELTHTLQTQWSGERAGSSEVAADIPAWKIEHTSHVHSAWCVPSALYLHGLFSRAHYIVCIRLLFLSSQCHEHCYMGFQDLGIKQQTHAICHWIFKFWTCTLRKFKAVGLHMRLQDLGKALYS